MTRQMLSAVSSGKIPLWRATRRRIISASRAGRNAEPVSAVRLALMSRPMMSPRSSSSRCMASSMRSISRRSSASGGGVSVMCRVFVGGRPRCAAAVLIRRAVPERKWCWFVLRELLRTQAQDLPDRVHEVERRLQTANLLIGAAARIPKGAPPSITSQRHLSTASVELHMQVYATLKMLVTRVSLGNRKSIDAVAGRWPCWP